jgi:hypothetical protein
LLVVSVGTIVISTMRGQSNFDFRLRPHGREREAQICVAVERRSLALDAREALLWKGEDFGHAGIASALKR